MSILSKILGRGQSSELQATTEPEEPTEHRATDRAGVYRVVSVTYPSGYVRKGIVVDLSPTGARLRFSQRGELPDQVELRIEGRAGTQRGEIVWQETHDAGIRFLD